MASLIYNGIKKNLPRWDVKIVCALHLLRKYQAVYDLVDMTREEVRKKFEQLEYLYLDTRRVGLFKIAGTTSLKSYFRERTQRKYAVHY